MCAESLIGNSRLQLVVESEVVWHIWFSVSHINKSDIQDKKEETD